MLTMRAHVKCNLPCVHAMMKAGFDLCIRQKEPSTGDMGNGSQRSSTCQKPSTVETALHHSVCESNHEVMKSLTMLDG